MLLEQHYQMGPNYLKTNEIRKIILTMTKKWIFLVHQGIGLKPYKWVLLQRVWWLLPKVPLTWG